MGIEYDIIVLINNINSTKFNCNQRDVYENRPLLLFARRSCVMLLDNLIFRLIARLRHRCRKG